MIHSTKKLTPVQQQKTPFQHIIFYDEQKA